MPPRQPRLPVEPLYEFLRVESASGASKMLMGDPRDLKRFEREGGITLAFCERYADVLAVHPSAIWGREYHAVSDNQDRAGSEEFIKNLSEKDFQTSVQMIAKRNGWLIYHNPDSRRCEPGFPDLVLVRPPEFLMVELKTAKGRVSNHQKEWLEALTESGIDARLWRPFDMSDVVKTLTKGSRN